MNENAEITVMPGTVRVLVPDLGEDAPTWELLEETLTTLRHWETHPDEEGEGLPPVTLPAPIADGAALEALREVLTAVLAVTGSRAQATGFGWLMSPEPPGGIWGIEPGALVERMPLRVGG
ncbi:hypothetical protein [Thermomonospora umbrina]|uniref:Uncharacterized protein n=1 Tax=Thermomonospora umbrina TaxID=111806 RepID=A0A3D9SXM8_9ACTN|nr:hypothetical protein [Thermomonospora umbrina]REF00609.1 hypothetical protein DFJ69_6164 [Thermomonospora umbrina]